MATLRSMSFGLLDMAFHSNNPTEITNIKALKSSFEGTTLYPDVAENCMSVRFRIFLQAVILQDITATNGPEVLVLMLLRISKKKEFSIKRLPQNSKENVLSKGGTELPMELYKRFRDRTETDALLKRAGLL